MLQLPVSSTKPFHSPLAPSDAEIIAAGKAFEPLLQKYIANHKEWARLHLETISRAKERTGPAEWEGNPGNDPMWRHFKEISAQNGYDKICHEQSSLQKKMQKLADVIWAGSPQTVEGLRAHGLVAIWECQPITADSSEMYFGDEVPQEKLFNAVVNFTGLGKFLDTKG